MKSCGSMKNSGTRLGQNFLVDDAACLRIALEAAYGETPKDAGARRRRAG